MARRIGSWFAIIGMLVGTMFINIPGAQAVDVTSVGSRTVTEQNSGSQTVQIAINGTSWAPGERVSYTTRDGTATASNGDYEPTSGSATCASGGNPCSTLFVDVPVYGDTDIEPDEVFYLDAGGKTGTITILNNDVPDPVVSLPVVSPSPSNEGQVVTASATFLDVDTVDNHTCTVDYGDGDGAQPGTVSGTTCTGPPHTYLDDELTGTANDPYTILVTVTDGDENVGIGTHIHTVRSAAPIVSTPVVTPAPSNETQSVTASATFTDPGTLDTHTCTVDYGDGSGPQDGVISGGDTCTGPTYTYPDDGTSGAPDGSYTVTVTVTDDDTVSGNGTVSHTVNNLPPTVGTPVVTPSSSNEGESVTASATFTDPGTLDTHACTVDYGDGSGPQDGVVSGDTCTGPAYAYPDDNPSGTASDSYTVTVTVTDDDTDSDSNTTSHTVSNLDPAITNIANDGPVDEGSPATLTVTATDPGIEDSFTYLFDCDNDTVYETAGAGDQGQCTFGDNGTFTVGVQVTDDDTGTATDTTTVAVENVAPTVDTPTVTPAPSNEGQSVVASATFTDPGTLDTHTCTVDYGDGAGPQAGTVSGLTCTGPAHTYLDDLPSGAPSGIYTVTVVVTDDDGDSGNNSVVQTVNNVAPVIISVTNNGSVPQGQPVTVTINAIDAGVNDILSYSFDCDNDGTYEIGPQASASADCSLEPDAATSTVGVQVEDDDTGVTTDTVDVGQTLTLCVNYRTGGISVEGVAGCPTGTLTLTSPGPYSTAFCVNPYTGALIWSPRGTCSSSYQPHVVPGDGPLYYCQNLWTGKLRVPRVPGQCNTGEIAGVIPG